MRWPLLEGLDSWSVDYEVGELRVDMTDGRVARSAWKGGRSGPLDFKRVTFRPGDSLLEMTLPWDEVLEVEVYAGDDQFQRRLGRTVVYLDQNQWIQLARSIHQPDALSPSQLKSARKLAELAQAREVILPVSSGHWIETSSVYGPRRIRLAAAMVGLSRGWIMRDPLRVRAFELKAMFESTRQREIAAHPKAVFTLDSRELYAETPERYQPSFAGLSTEIGTIIDTLAGVQAVVAVLLEDERTERETAAASGWAALHQSFAQHLATEPATRGHVRTLTLFRFLADLGVEHLVAARDSGLNPTEYQTWLRERADEDISRLPYLGRNREVVHLRLQNPQKRWESNDLIDLMYLPCAAAYAEFVVCEKHTGDLLQRASRGRPGGAKVLTSITELMRYLVE